MSRDFPVSGLAELDAYLAALPTNMQKGAYRAGLVAAARPVRDKARQNARKASGKMARAIKTGSPRQNEDGSFSVVISLKGEHSFLGWMIESGVAPHLIKPGDANVTARKLNKRQRSGDSEIKEANGLLKIGGSWVRGAVMHPGHVAHPFMRPALDTEAEAATAAFGVRIRDYLAGKTGFVAPLEEEAE